MGGLDSCGLLLDHGRVILQIYIRRRQTAKEKQVAVIYEVFEFTQGKSLKDINGPVTYIKVREGEDKFKILEKEELPGNVFGYGLREVPNLLEEQMKLSQEYYRVAKLVDKLYSYRSVI
jgi:hypothetical protein